MSKVEDKAKKFLKTLVSHTTLYKGTIDELEVYEPDDVIWAYKEGYHQAEEGNELTVDDIELILDLYAQTSQYNDWDLKEKKEVFEEILKRFKERKQQ